MLWRFSVLRCLQHTRGEKELFQSDSQMKVEPGTTTVLAIGPAPARRLRRCDWIHVSSKSRQALGRCDWASQALAGHCLFLSDFFRRWLMLALREDRVQQIEKQNKKLLERAVRQLWHHASFSEVSPGTY